MSGDGFGSMENSSDYPLRVYKIRPNFDTTQGGSGKIHVESFIGLHDPDKKIPFTIAIISVVSAAYGRQGKVLEAPIRLANFENPLRLRSRNDFRVSICRDRGCDCL